MRGTAHDDGPSTDSDDHAAGPGDAGKAAARVRRWPSAGAQVQGGTCQVCGTSLAALREYYQRSVARWMHACRAAMIAEGAVHQNVHAAPLTPHSVPLLVLLSSDSI